MRKSDGKRVAIEIIGVVAAVEMRYVVVGVLRILGDIEQLHILRGDKAGLQQLLLDEVNPAVPEGFSRRVHEHHGENGALAGLDEGDSLEYFIHGAEAAGERDQGIALLQEVELAGEEVVEIHHLVAAGHDGVRVLLERQGDIQAEGVSLRGALVAGLHEPRPATGDDHVALAGHQVTEAARLDIAGVSLLDAGRAETRNLAAVLVGLEHLVSLEHFINRAVHDFQRMLAQRTGRRVHDRGKHLQHRIRRMLAAEAAGKVVQIRIQHRVAGTGGYGERGMCFRPAVDITRC